MPFSWIIQQKEKYSHHNNGVKQQQQKQQQMVLLVSFLLFVFFTICGCGSTVDGYTPTTNNKYHQYQTTRTTIQLQHPLLIQRRNTRQKYQTNRSNKNIHHPFHRMNMNNNLSDNNEQQEKENNLFLPTFLSTSTTGTTNDNNNNELNVDTARTNTVNERLLNELQAAANKEKYGTRSSMSKQSGSTNDSSTNNNKNKKNQRKLVDYFRSSSSKTDEERLAAIEEARNLNGINPLVTILGAGVALGCATLLWSGTNAMATNFALHPIDTSTNSDTIYFVQRVTAVYRNILIGLISLASGFFGVTGFGIFLLGIRVGYGVLIGELDPTPLPTSKTTTTSTSISNIPWLMTTKSTTDSQQDQQQQSTTTNTNNQESTTNNSGMVTNAWDLMLNKKPNRTTRR